LKGTGRDHLKLFIGYLIGADVMIAGGHRQSLVVDRPVEQFLTAQAERRDWTRARVRWSRGESRIWSA
jgi:hypothetical protein